MSDPKPNGKHDVLTHRIVVSCLGACVLLTGGAITLLAVTGHDIPVDLSAFGPKIFLRRNRRFERRERLTEQPIGVSCHLRQRHVLTDNAERGKDKRSPRKTTGRQSGRPADGTGAPPSSESKPDNPGAADD